MTELDDQEKTAFVVKVARLARETGLSQKDFMIGCIMMACTIAIEHNMSLSDLRNAVSDMYSLVKREGWGN